MTAARLPQDLPSVEYLRECFDYDPETGILTWKERPRSHFSTDAGHKTFNSQVAGTPVRKKERDGYLTLGINKRFLRAHRVAWAIYYGQWPTDQLDHINLNKSDNRIVNLK